MRIFMLPDPRKWRKAPRTIGLEVYDLKRCRRNAPRAGERIWEVCFSVWSTMDGESYGRMPDRIYVYAVGVFSAVRVARHHAYGCMDASKVQEVRSRVCEAPKASSMGMKYRVSGDKIIEEWC